MSNKFKRIFWDIETSPAIAVVWRTGKSFITSKNIIEPQKIICICWKVEGEKKVHELHWDKNQDDKKLVQEFAKIANDSDQLVAHNGDKFDMAFFRYRCLVHGVDFPPDHKTVDTLKWARKMFMNSRKLNDIDIELGGDGKMDTGGLDLWKRVKIEKSEAALKKMIRYCKKDVVVLERVYNKLSPYNKNNVHIGVHEDNDRISCGNCGSHDMALSKTRTTASGIKRRQMHCKSCGHYHTVSDLIYQKIAISKLKE